jgi:type IV pilus assembly protein PilO
MAKFNEMSFGARAGILALIAVIFGVAYWYMYLNGEVQTNQQLRKQIADKTAENALLRPFVDRQKELDRNMAILQQQMEIQKKIVPDEKDADQFIRLLHDTAATSGIEIRRYASLPVANRDFYSEVPFTLDIDGPYYSVLNFFQRVSELERIINIDNLQMANTKTTGPSKVKTTYTYSPGETVVASCTATTFYSHDLETPTPAGPPRPGQPPAPVQQKPQ